MRALLAVLAFSLAASTVDTADQPAGDLLVVQANLQDAIRPADVADTRDLDNFVARLAERAPGAPDAVLLAEVLGPGAQRVAARLSAAFGQPYRAVVTPGRQAFAPDGSVRETAIVLNTRTLSAEETGYARIQSEDQAYADIRHGGERLRLVAGHIGGDPAVAAEEFHELGPTVLGADLRLARCMLVSVDCAPQPFWSTLTDRYAYTDAAYEAALSQDRPDTSYLLTSRAVSTAYVDEDYAIPDHAGCKKAYDSGKSGTTSGACRTGYYADAPFTLATIGATEPVRRVVLPREVTLDHCEFGTRVAAIVTRLANRTPAPVTEPVTASAPAPLTVTPTEGSLAVPAGEARRAGLRVTAPQEAAPGQYSVTVHIGTASTVVPVSIPAGPCREPAVYASSFNPGHPPENAIDGDIATFWHTEWSPPAPLPQSITLNLGGVRDVSELRYQPRFDGNLNGTIRDYVVSVSVDGRIYTQVAAGTWVADAREKAAAFPPAPARYVKLEAHSAVGGSFASGAEVSAR